VLTVLAYWLSLDARGQRLRCGYDRAGRWWVAKTYTQLGNDAKLSKRQAERAVAGLTATGVVVVRRGRFAGKTSNFYRIDWDRAHALYAAGGGTDTGLLYPAEVERYGRVAGLPDAALRWPDPGSKPDRAKARGASSRRSVIGTVEDAEGASSTADDADRDELAGVESAEVEERVGNEDDEDDGE
jgi:hypothetical protein